MLVYIGIHICRRVGYSERCLNAIVVRMSTFVVNQLQF